MEIAVGIAAEIAAEIAADMGAGLQPVERAEIAVGIAARILPAALDDAAAMPDNMRARVDAAPRRFGEGLNCEGGTACPR